MACHRMPLGMRYPLACGFMGLLQTSLRKHKEPSSRQELGKPVASHFRTNLTIECLDQFASHRGLTQRVKVREPHTDGRVISAARWRGVFSGAREVARKPKRTVLKL